MSLSSKKVGKNRRSMPAIPERRVARIRYLKGTGTRRRRTAVTHAPSVVFDAATAPRWRRRWYYAECRKYAHIACVKNGECASRVVQNGGIERRAVCRRLLRVVTDTAVHVYAIAVKHRIEACSRSAYRHNMPRMRLSPAELYETVEKWHLDVGEGGMFWRSRRCPRRERVK